MSSFEFLSVLISVVVGLGIANILSGVGRMIHRHTEVRLSIAYVAWALYVFHYLVIYWWTVVFGWQEWQNWNLVIFAFILTYGVILFLLSVILFPTDLPTSWDFGKRFLEMRRWFFGIFGVLIIVEVMDTVLKDHLGTFSVWYQLQMATWAVCAIIGWISTNRRVHATIALVALVSQVSWVIYQLRDLEWSLGA